MSPTAHVLIERLVRWGLGGVFVYAGALKVVDPLSFADSIASFQIVPVPMIVPVALVLPVFEAIMGILLIVGIRRKACAATIGVLCAIFAIALTQAWMRGLAVDCGCFGAGEPSGLKTGLALMRDLMLGALACWLWGSERLYSNEE